MSAGVRGTFATRRATLPVNSACRFSTVSSIGSIAVLCRRPLTALCGCRPSFYVMFLTSKCLKSRTVARQTCSMCSECRTVVNLDRPLGSRWAEGPRTEFWRLSQTATIPVWDTLYIHFAFFGSRGSRTTLGHPAGLAGWLAGLAGWAGWLAGWAGWGGPGAPGGGRERSGRSSAKKLENEAASSEI